MRWYQLTSAVYILPLQALTIISRDSKWIRYVMKCSRPGIWASSEEQFESIGQRRQEYCRAFLLTRPASLQIYLKTKKRLHIKTIIQLPLDCIVTPTRPPFHFLEHHYGRLGVRVETFYTAVKFVFVFQSRIYVCQLLLTHLLLQLVHFGYQVIYLVQGPWKKREPLENLRYVIQLYDIICSHHL